MKLLGSVILFSCVLVILAEKARYDHYRIYSVEIENGEQLKVLQEVENHHDGISFMIPPIAISQKVDVLVPPHKFAQFSDLLESYALKNFIKVENLQE